MLFGQTAHVQDGVAHASQGSVDAHAGGVGDFFEAHIPVVTHHEHLALAGGQGLDELAHVVVNLSGDEGVLDGHVGQILAVKDVGVGVIGGLQVLGPDLTVVVNNQVVGDACDPRGEMPVLDISSLLDGGDGFDKGVLEDVVEQNSFKSDGVTRRSFVII